MLLAELLESNQQGAALISLCHRRLAGSLPPHSGLQCCLNADVSLSSTRLVKAPKFIALGWLSLPILVIRLPLPCHPFPARHRSVYESVFFFFFLSFEVRRIVHFFVRLKTETLHRMRHTAFWTDVDYLCTVMSRWLECDSETIPLL